ncbi:MAG TPA: Asp23/Gls24 family envelope stress response protein [Anaerolineae bacterium]|nr:Asp23/Gls24 family envelope stress response protein [Anaerolineae bacterium]
MTDEESHGTITIAPNVLNTIARLTTQNIEGVARLGASGKLLRANEGVAIEITDGRVKADIFIVVKPEVNLFDVGQQIQHNVARLIKDIVGMDVESVNVHVQDVDYVSPKPG